MCFSASASFIASGLLSLCGGIALWRSVHTRRTSIFVAGAPLLFALQQAAEGLVWLHGYSWAALTFLFFAFGVWPFYIPFSLLVAESDKKKRKALCALTVLGSGVSLCLLISLVSSPVAFHVQGCHLVYDVVGRLLAMPWLRWPVSVCYCITTIAPFAISSMRYMPVVGLLIGLSCLVTCLFYTVYFISVWCFFAALISSAVVVIIYGDSE